MPWSGPNSVSRFQQTATARRSIRGGPGAASLLYKREEVWTAPGSVDTAVLWTRFRVVRFLDSGDLRR
jgi:hypothetical protein